MYVCSCIGYSQPLEGLFRCCVSIKHHAHTNCVGVQLAARLLDAWGDFGPGQLRSAPELAATEAMADLLACLQLLLPQLQSLPGVPQSPLQGGPYVGYLAAWDSKMPGV